MSLKFQEDLKEALSVDDVLLVPQYSTVRSRADVDLKSRLMVNEHLLSLPVIASPMDTVSEADMGIAMGRAGAMAIIHRYNTIEEQAEFVSEVFKRGETDDYPTIHLGAAIGVIGDYLERAQELFDHGIRVINIDVAHGDHIMTKEAIEALRGQFGNYIHIMAGAIATGDAYDHMWQWGVDSVRAGVGGGSICSTRIQTGHGVPTFTTVLECMSRKKHILGTKINGHGSYQYSSRPPAIIADGGIKCAGDVAKMLAAGADFTVIGSLFAGCYETPGLVLTDELKQNYKIYRGMASRDAQSSWRDKEIKCAEGITARVPYRGPVLNVLNEIEGGLRSALSYTGAWTLQEFKEKAKLIRQTQAGADESSTHILRRYLKYNGA